MVFHLFIIGLGFSVVIIYFAIGQLFTFYILEIWDEELFGVRRLLPSPHADVRTQKIIVIFLWPLVIVGNIVTICMTCMFHAFLQMYNYVFDPLIPEEQLMERDKRLLEEYDALLAQRVRVKDELDTLDDQIAAREGDNVFRISGRPR